MSLDEFDIISKYFDKPGLTPGDMSTGLVPLAIGDDCALINVPPGKQLAVSIDMLVAATHFPAAADPALVAHKALAVNLSDLAAMGATPLAFTLALSLPERDETWFEAFSRGLTEAAGLYACPLIGGDLTRGPLTITIGIHGLCEADKVLKRSGAEVGDLVYVSGKLGAAGLALGLINNGLDLNAPDREELFRAYYKPVPRFALGQACAGIASAGIDISDGLLADLGHVAHRSGVGMEIDCDKVPVSGIVKRTLSALGDTGGGMRLAMTAGDDYELALTVSPDRCDELEAIAGKTETAITRIGRVIEGQGIRCRDRNGKEIEFAGRGYRHF